MANADSGEFAVVSLSIKKGILSSDRVINNGSSFSGASLVLSWLSCLGSYG